MDNLLKRQEELQKEGWELLEYLKLLQFLEQFGVPMVVGSLDTGLMTWHDIDIELVKTINEDEYWQTVKFLFHQPDFKRTLVMDFRKSMNPNSPKGLHICVKDLSFKENIWKIDLWFVPPRSRSEANFHEWMKKHMKDEHRPYILAIKHGLAKNPKHRTEIFSIDIYKAVIEEGVRDMEGFRSYLSKSGRQL